MKLTNHTRDSTALITGGESGIGLEYARQLAACGCRLALVSNRPQALEEAARVLRESYGVRVDVLEADLALPGAARTVVEWCDREQINPEILINNAGMFFMEYLSPASLDKADKMMALHMQTAADLCILFGARMKERGRGYILNMGSMTAWIPAPGIAVYSASKAFLVTFCRGLSHELRPYGVRVTAVCPAAVDTGLYPLSPRLRRNLRRLGIIRTPEWLARKGLRALFRGRRLLRPGPLNHLIPFLVRLLPARTVDRLGHKWIER